MNPGAPLTHGSFWLEFSRKTSRSKLALPLALASFTPFRLLLQASSNYLQKMHTEKKKLSACKYNHIFPFCCLLRICVMNIVHKYKSHYFNEQFYSSVNWLSLPKKAVQLHRKILVRLHEWKAFKLKYGQYYCTKTHSSCSFVEGNCEQRNKKQGCVWFLMGAFYNSKLAVCSLWSYVCIIRILISCFATVGS